MESQIEKILCIEILEKISRMRRYLSSHYSSSKTEGKEVVGLFLSALSATEQSLESIIIYIKKSGKLNPYEKATVSRRISDTFLTIVKLHEQLQLVYGSWVRPETHTFISEILDFFPANRKHDKINIVLTNDYMFFESNLTGWFTSILNRYDISNNFIVENPTVFLPKIDYDNPLNWTILAHECGHTDLKGISKLLDNPKLVPESIVNGNRKKLKNWIEEIYCDLLATKILGPAYLASFCTYGLLISGMEGNEESDEEHPSNVLRINLIQEYLETRNIIVPLEISFDGHSDLSSYYYFMLEQYNETSRKYLNPYSDTVEPTIDTTLLLDIISEEVDDFIELNTILTNEDFKRIHSLKNRLSRGITIASYQDIEKLESARNKYPKNTSDKVELDELNEAKEALQESRAKLWEIINTGWINKVENILPNAIKLFFEDEDLSFTKKSKILGDELEKNDNILLKSIESSEIFKIMEEQYHGTF